MKTFKLGTAIIAGLHFASALGVETDRVASLLALGLAIADLKPWRFKPRLLAVGPCQKSRTREELRTLRVGVESILAHRLLLPPLPIPLRHVADGLKGTGPRARAVRRAPAWRHPRRLLPQRGPGRQARGPSSSCSARGVLSSRRCGGTHRGSARLGLRRP